MRSYLFTSVVGVALGIGVLVCAPRDASACGGCFHEPPAPMQTITVVTDHRMAFSVTKTSTTLYDQVRYMGDPSKFAWVLPIAGNVDVGLSADVMFASLDAITRTTVTAPTLPPCPPPPSCYCPSTYRSHGLSCGSATYASGYSDDGGASFADASFSADASKQPPGVEVTKREVVGPYEAVQLKATDPMSITAWLVMNGFEIPDDVKPIIAAYQAEGFGFLALKLLPGQGINSMRPVRVTTPGASLALPLRMVSAGTGANVGITLWVVGEGRYEPIDFPWFRVADGDLVWDWATSSSNYATVRQKKTAESNGYGWEMESSTDVSIAQLQRLVYSSGTGLGTVPADMDYDPVVDKVNPQNSKSADEVRDEDLMTLFGSLSNPRVTRVRADLVRAALGKDLHLTASTDQTTLPGTHQITHDVNRPVCPTYPPCPPCPPTDVEGLGGGGGCSAAADGAPDLGLLFVAGFVGLSIVRRRRRR